MKNEVRFTRRCERLTKALNELGVDYAIAGAMAMFLHGFRRFTEDVDVLVTREGLAKNSRGLGRPRLCEAVCGKQESSRCANRRENRFSYRGQYPGDGKPGPIAFPDTQRSASKDADGIRVYRSRSS